MREREMRVYLVKQKENIIFIETLQIPPHKHTHTHTHTLSHTIK